MPETPLGITYPDETGHTRLWEHLQALAETTDTAIGTAAPLKIQTGQVSIGLGSNAVSAEKSVNFPEPFTAAPAVMVSTRASSSTVNVWNCSFYNETSTGATIAAGRSTGSGGTATVFWFAVGV